MRVIVCGSREFPSLALVDSRLDELSRDGLVIVHGGARGVDRAAEAWALVNGVSVARYLAEWQLYGKAAGARRNEAMASDGADLCLAFTERPFTPGTGHMIGAARRRGIPVEIIGSSFSTPELFS